MKHQYKLLSIMLAGGLLTACSSDEPGITSLPYGKYPLKLNVTVGAPQSRSIGKDAWTGDGSEAIGVRIGVDGTTAKYVVTDKSGKVEAAADASPLYWDNTDEATVYAWLPYATQSDIDISDQSSGFADYDYLSASAEGQSYLFPVNLQFSHKMAKVKCVLHPGKGLSESDLSDAVIKIAGYTSVTFNEGTLTGDGDGWIAPTTDGEALLVPQDMTGKEFIHIIVGNKEYSYTPKNSSDGLIREGLSHVYNITVHAHDIDVQAVTVTSWSLQAIGGASVSTYYNGTETEPKAGDYYYSDGTWSDGGLRKLGGDDSMVWADPLPAPIASKKVIGIVFFGGHNSNDNSDYTDSGIGKKKCHGYVVALNDIGKYSWATNSSASAAGCTASSSDWSGYFNCQTLISRYVNLDNYPAAKQCYEYGVSTDTASPSASSGWYLPSCGQLETISHLPSLAAVMSKAGGVWLKSDSPYWTSTEDIMSLGSNYQEIIVYEVSMQDKWGRQNFNKYSENYVRAVLSF